MNRQTDRFLFEQIKKSDEKAFEALFRAHYPFLCLYATHLLKEPSAAEEIVQELFVRLWEKREDITIEISVKNYLYRSVKNYCINYIRHSKIKNDYVQNIQAEQDFYAGEEFDSQAELIEKIEESIASLPERRREIFRLSRQEGLKYKEIAAKLNISVKTVETQMGIAIKYLRKKLKDFLLFF